MRFPNSKEVRSGLLYILANFATPLGFYLTFQLFGAKPAIGLAIAITLIQLIFHRIYRVPVSPFFIIASGFTVVFGFLDLLIEDPHFFKFEPFFQNLIIGTVFLGSIFIHFPILSRFAAALPDFVRPLISGWDEPYLKKLTWVCVFYLYLKAAVFYYLALQVDLGELIFYRSVVGGGSLMLMFGSEWFYRRCLKK